MEPIQPEISFESEKDRHCLFHLHSDGKPISKFPSWKLVFPISES